MSLSKMVTLAAGRFWKMGQQAMRGRSKRFVSGARLWVARKNGAWASCVWVRTENPGGRR